MEELQELRFQSIKHQFPNIEWKVTDSNTEDRSASPIDLLGDNMSGELLRQLDLSQLAPLPRTVDIFGKPTEDLVESYKSTLRESMARENVSKMKNGVGNGAIHKSNDLLDETKLGNVDL